MFRWRTICFLMAALLLSAVTSEGYTKVGRTKKKKKDNSKMVYTPIKYNLMLKGNIGYILESDEDFSSFYKPDNKMFYGFGIAGEYHTNGKLAFGIHYDRLFYNYNANSFDNKLLVQTYTISAIYKFTTKKTSIPIVTINYGIAKPDIRNASTGKTIKFGFGYIAHTAGKFNLRSVLYYQRFFSSDELSFYLADGNLNVISFDISCGIPL